MPAKRPTEDVVEVVAPPAPSSPSITELQDELEQLKAQGNPRPARLAELKQLLAGKG